MTRARCLLIAWSASLAALAGAVDPGAAAPVAVATATTPALRLLTVSMNCGGQDHSRPTKRPTFAGVAKG